MKSVICKAEWVKALAADTDTDVSNAVPHDADFQRAEETRQTTFGHRLRGGCFFATYGCHIVAKFATANYTVNPGCKSIRAA